MTVKELIQRLQACDPEAGVLTSVERELENPVYHEVNSVLQREPLEPDEDESDYGIDELDGYDNVVLLELAGLGGGEP